MDFNKNYYATLGVNKDSNQEEIKKQYRKLAKEHHPDSSQNHDDTKFKEINEAFSILSNDDQRQKYDVYSPHGKNYSPGFGNSFFHININEQDFSPFGGSPFGFSANPFEDPFFRDIFSRREEFPEELDIRKQINITLQDVYNNAQIPIKFSRNIKCDVCNFTGFDPEGEEFECEACDGKGGDGFTQCRYCNGSGKIHTGSCPNCHGEKVILKGEDLAFGNTYRIDKSFVKYMKNLGHHSKHYRNKIGTLIIEANYINDNRYVRNGFDLIHQLNIHYQDAIDGVKYEHVHLDNKKYSINIPPKTKDGDLLRVAGRGLLVDGNKRADFIIKINIIIDYERLH